MQTTTIDEDDTAYLLRRPRRVLLDLLLGYLDQFAPNAPYKRTWTMTKQVTNVDDDFDSVMTGSLGPRSQSLRPSRDLQQLDLQVLHECVSNSKGALAQRAAYANVNASEAAQQIRRNNSIDVKVWDNYRANAMS